MKMYKLKLILKNIKDYRILYGWNESFQKIEIKF